MVGHERRVLGAARERPQLLVRHRDEKLRLAGSDYPCHRMIARGVQRVARTQAFQIPGHAGASGRDGDPGDRPILSAAVDHAQVSEPRHGESGDLLHRCRHIERAREDRPRLDQKPTGDPTRKQLIGRASRQTRERTVHGSG
jgi:hypothetical protein